MQSKGPTLHFTRQSKALLTVAFAAFLLVAGWILFDNHREKRRDDQLSRTNFDAISEILRKESNRIEVQKVSGKVTTVREVSGGPWGMFRGRLVIQQPFTVSYFVNMKGLTRSEYDWDEASRTLNLRVPEIEVQKPAVDASKQEVSADGWVITREMQEKLRHSIAVGAERQVREESLKSDHMNAARYAARKAIAQNLAAALNVAGLGDVKVVVAFPTDGTRDGSRITGSVPYEQAIEDGRRRRAAEARQ